MGSKSKKREREPGQGEKVEEVAPKRRRQLDEGHLRLSKLYEELAAESDDVRFEAAKQIIVKFSPENAPSAEAVETALGRLIKGLCSQRKAARIGFSLTLTELLRQFFGQNAVRIEGLELNVESILKMVGEKTKINGNVPGRERRDHLIGKLFGYKAVLQSSIVIEPELSLECWNELLDQVYGLARDVPWLREECGMVLVEAIKSLKDQPQYEKCAEEMVARLSTFKLVNTPEGVAVWLTVQASYEGVLPEGVWHHKDPLDKKERARLAKTLKENFRGDTTNGKDDDVKTAAANPNPTFAWDLVLSEILRRDGLSRVTGKENPKTDFAQFWLDTVDNNLFTLTSSHERKAWGFKLLSSMITRVPEWAVSALFSPNLMRSLINQSKKEDRFLHNAAVAALNTIQIRVQQEPSSALSIFVALTTKNGSIESDQATKTKTLEQILLAADDETLKKIVRHLNSLILRPESEDQVVADSRRQTIGDLLLNLVKHYKHYDELSEDSLEKNNWLHKILEILVEYAYFVPSKNAKTSKVPLPTLSERSRNMFQERLSSCLTKLLGVGGGSRSAFALTIVDMIRSKNTSSKSLDLAFKADKPVLKTMEKASQTLDAISAKGSIGGNKSAAEGFILLYSLTLLQVYNGDGDAVMMLDDLDASRKAMSNKKTDAEGEGHDAFVEIILSFLGNPRTLFRKIAEEAFGIFASEISPEGLQSLTDVLDTEENLEGQKELFKQSDSEAEEGGSDDDSEDASDVEMIDGSSKSDDGSDSDSSSDSDSASDDESEDDAELTQFNNLLSMTLQTSKLNPDGDDTSDDSDMDDEQMEALDPQLSKIFQQRSKVHSKKKERQDAKQNIVQFKSRILDLLAIYLDKQFSNALTLDTLLPMLRRTRANANKQVSEKSAKVLKQFLASRRNKAPLPKPENVEGVWSVLKAIHEEAKMGNGAKLHGDVCSSASLHVVKVLVAMDKKNYEGCVDVYGSTQKEWFGDRKVVVVPGLFTMFLNWSVGMRGQGK